MKRTHASKWRTAVCSALLLLAVFPSVSPARWGEDSFAEEGRRNRERAEEERRNARQREEEAKRRINAGKEQGERDLAEIDQEIRVAQAFLSQANLKGKEWVDAGSREVPAQILARGRRVSAELAKVRRERADCGTALHSPSSLVADTLRRISELDRAARAVSTEAQLLLADVGGLFTEDVREELRVLDEKLAAGISIINWAKNSVRKLEAEELRATKDYQRKMLEEEAKAEKRAASKRSQAGGASARRRSSGLNEAKEQMRLRSFDSNEAKLQFNESIWYLEGRYRSLVRRREEAGKKLARNDTKLKEDAQEVEVLKSDVDAFCGEIDDFAKQAEPYFGKAPNGSADMAENENPSDGDSSEKTAEGNDPGTKPKTGSGSRFVYSWTPWESSDVLSAERR